MAIGARDTSISLAITGSKLEYAFSTLSFTATGGGMVPLSLSMPINSPVTITPMMAPVEDIPTRPKLFASAFLLLFFIEETPAASASINGVVNAPVVAPEASKAMERKSSDENRDKTKISP